MPTQTPPIGRARTVLIFREDSASRAVLSTVVARVRRENGRKRLVVRGPAQFEPQSLGHIEEVIVPLVDRLLERLVVKRRPKPFELCVVNLGAASIADAGLSIEGFSSDAAILLALLSAALRAPLPQNLVTTGHIASPDGDIRAVAGLPAKLAAAIEDGGIEWFLCPALVNDSSLRILSPAEAQAAETAVATARTRLRVTEVADICQLIEAAWTDEDLVAASLRCGFFNATPAPTGGAIVEQAVAYLGTGNEERFWRVLEAHLQEGHAAAASNLLRDRLKHDVARKEYPASFGRQLFALMLSVPPTVRQLKLVFPLVSIEACFAVGRFAGPEDREDAQYLMDAVLGRFASHVGLDEPPATAAPVGDKAAAAVQAVLSEIDRETLVRKIALPIDAARAGYVLDHVVIDSYDVLRETVCSFYRTLVRHTGAAPASGDPEMIAAEAFSLLERAFADEGGAAGAWAEARHGTHGGLRYVLDLMTERFKAEHQSSHVSRVVRVAVDPLDWSERVEFIRGLIDHLGPHLPPDLRAQPPERFARHYEAICQTYARSLDRVKDLFRTL
ncbi:MAG: hypothetical protein QUV05_20090 [Phycisphaerae bacterium]|nr:hypothetical protein [Phycisphaerae bacterium]